jgi:hypothetical protein
MRAKLYDVLDTKTGVMIGEGLRCREVSNLIDVDLDHISQYAGRGQRCKRRYIIMPCGEVTAEHPRKELLAKEWDKVRMQILAAKRKEVGKCLRTE